MTTAKLVMVEWLDAHSEDEHSSLEDMTRGRPFRFLSVGWAVKDDAEGIGLLANWTDHQEDPGGFGYLFVPRGVVLRVRPLKKPPGRP